MNTSYGILSKFSEEKMARSLMLVLGLFFLITIHYYHINVGGFGLSLPFNILSWIPISWAIGIGLLFCATQKKIIYSKFGLILAIAVLLMVMPSFLQQSVSFGENALLIGLMAGLLFFFSLQQFKFNDHQVMFLLGLILAGIYISAFIAWLQFVGFSMETWHFTGIGKRPIGHFGQANVMASFMATGVVLSAFLPSFCKLKAIALPKSIVIAFYSAPLILAPILVLVISRTGILGLVLAVPLVLVFMYRQCGKNSCLLWLALLAAGITVAIFLLSMTGTTESAMGNLNLDSLRERTYPQVLAMILEKPVWGYGYGNFEAAYIQFTADAFAQGEMKRPGLQGLSHPHNEILFWWVEGGVLALGGLLLAAFVIVKNILTVESWNLKLGLIGLMLPVVLHSQLELPFISSVAHWIVFVIFIFLVDYLCGDKSERNISIILAPALGGLLIPVMTTLFMLSTLQTDRVLSRFERNPEVDINTLTKITNPIIWQDRIAWDLNFGQLVLGLYTGRLDLIAPFINWAPELVKRKPRGIYYQYLVIAYRAMGNDIMAERTRIEAEYLLPEYSFDYSVSGLEELDNWYPSAARDNVVTDQMDAKVR